MIAKDKTQESHVYEGLHLFTIALTTSELAIVSRYASGAHLGENAFIHGLICQWIARRRELAQAKDRSTLGRGL